MNDWKLPWRGGCRCGTLRFEISQPPLIASVCHCRGCQLMTGSAFSTTLVIPVDGFAVISGTPVIGGLHGDDAHHQHCDRCKSWTFTTMAAPEMAFVNVRATMLDDASWFVPYMETQTAEMLPWATTPAVRRYERFPKMDEYEALAAEYAEKGVRPA